MKLIDNVNEILREDLKQELNKDTKISIVAANFSIYAFRELMKELKQVKELNFVFKSLMALEFLYAAGVIPVSFKKTLPK